jgi:hypothetical protein
MPELTAESSVWWRLDPSSHLVEGGVYEFRVFDPCTVLGVVMVVHCSPLKVSLVCV